MNHNNGVPDVVFTSLGRNYGLCRARNLRAITTSSNNSPAARQVPVLPTHDIHYFSTLLQRARAFEIRQLLNDDPNLFHTLDEKQVINHVASLLKNGSIILLELPSNSSPRSKNSVRKPIEDFEYVDLKHLPSSSELAINQSSSPQKKSTDVVLDEQVFISVLVAAAASGAALCEVCSKQEDA